ncbi:MAG: translocation/assembly module TamB domain-containing protein [Flavobacteriia bacterium]|jgi:hypothetical protein
MTKILKIIGRTIGISFEWILILLIAFAFAIRTSPVQTYLAKKAAAFLSKEWNTRVEVGSVSIIFIDRVALDDVLVLDHDRDTLASIHTIYATLDKLDLKKNILDLGEAELDGGVIHLSIDKKTGEFNFQFIIDYFASDKPSKSKPMAVSLRRLQLIDVDFKHTDYRQKHDPEGIDFDHLDFKHVNLSAEAFRIVNGKISANIESFSAEEQSGFKLNQLSAKVNVSPKGILLSSLVIKTDDSDIKAPKLNLLMNDYADMGEFIDKVSFDAQLAKSSVSLKDVSYFATALWGMDQVIQIKANVTKRIKDLKISGLELKTGKRTVVRGTVNLPDFRNFKRAFFSEKLDYAFISLSDLQKIRMPNSADNTYLSFDKTLQRLGYFEAIDLRLDGFYSQFVVSTDKLNTKLGTVRMDNGIMFTQNFANNSFLFQHSEASDYDVKVEQFQLGQFLDNRSLGVVDGTFFLTGEAFSLSDIHFTEITGDVNRFDYLDYAYTNIRISEGSFEDNKFAAIIDVKDDNLDLEYNGFIDFKDDQHMSFTIDLKKALLDKLHIAERDSTSLKTNFVVNIYGNDPNKMAGNVTMHGLLYKEGKNEIKLPDININVTRSATEDVFKVVSPIADVTLTGKIDFSTLVDDFLTQFEKVFPSIVATRGEKKIQKGTKSNFSYNLTTKDTKDFLTIFAPELFIASNSILIGNYSGKDETFTMGFISPEVDYQDMTFKGIDLKQAMTSTEIQAIYTVKKFQYKDSISLDNVKFTTQGGNKGLNSKLTWNTGSKNETDIAWKTTIVNTNHINFVLEPSYFSINDMRWDIENQSDILLSDRDVHITKLKLQKKNTLSGSKKDQYVSIDGCISRNDADRLNFKLHDLDLGELGELLGSHMKLKGSLNSWGYISNPYENLTYLGDVSVEGLYLNNQEVGDIYAQSGWNKASQSIAMNGDLIYRGQETFSFEGHYFTERKEENIEMDLVFDETDIGFANAFLDADVVSSIRGKLNGKLRVSGTPDFPKLDGSLKLIDGNAKMEMLGVNFGFNGKISADEYGFYIDNMPVSDEDGNTGSLIGSVYHNQYKDWNFDLQFDLEQDYYARGKNGPLQLQKFLVLNTPYKEGETYYGKAYGTGSANIFGYTDNLEITVDIKTEKGTQIYFPMFGVSEISEEETFIRFKQNGNQGSAVDPKFNFSGVSLDLNFRVTPDAMLKIIFNKQSGDEITATGSGDIAMQLDNLGDLSMEGTFRLKNGLYNFAMGSLKQKFYIEEGGTITWTGDPYTADIDLNTYLIVRANISEISPDQLQGNKGNQQDIYCYLSLKESLLKPTIGFNIKAPKADETSRALIDRITGDKDELNRQFFSLMLMKKFQPLRGSAASGSSTAMDLASNQINSILDKVSKDYKMNVNLDADQNTGESSFEFGIKKGFIGDRLIFTGSFGVENSSGAQQQQGQSALIGDVSLEYLINESGTFRINVFNESNDYSIIQDKNLGPYSQGAGLHYQEDFDTWRNFKIGQYFLDIFRSKENKRFPIKRKRRQTPVPAVGDSGSILRIRKDHNS